MSGSKAGAEALPVLLSRVLGRVTRDLESEAGPAAPLAVWANVLRPVADAHGSTTERALAPTARISKRLAVAAVTGAARRGWVAATPPVERGAGRGVALTALGAAADERWRRLLARFEEERSPSDLATSLRRLVAQLPLELPWFPASYGTSDPSAVGGSFVRGQPSDGIPPHGQDWKPVVRAAAGDTTTGVPLPGLLSQALMAFTIDYEATPVWPLASTTLVVRHLRPTPMPLADLAGDHGITGNGRSLLERHGVAVVTGSAVGGPKFVHLTPRGRRIRDRHEPTLAAVEGSWRARYGGDTIEGLRSVLAADPAATDRSLPDHVVAPLHRS